MIGKIRLKLTLLIILIVSIIIGCNSPSNDKGNKLAEWRKGVWISGDGTYTIYTNDHYFVISYEGDSVSPNIYCGTSQLVFHNKGMARKQVIRLRQNPGGDLNSFRAEAFKTDSSEIPLVIDSNLFTPGTCNIKDGIIYDAVTEVTDDYILLATCNGDKEKIYSNGISVYLPVGGGEYYSYRIEKF
jgi:hypothetical protein